MTHNAQKEESLQRLQVNVYDVHTQEIKEFSSKLVLTLRTSGVILRGLLYAPWLSYGRLRTAQTQKYIPKLPILQLHKNYLFHS